MKKHHMGGENSLPLNEAVLKPMETLKRISDDDPFWEVLFNRAVMDMKPEGEKYGFVILHIPEFMGRMVNSHPETLKQLVRLSIAKLLDLIRRCSFETEAELFQPMQRSILTTLVLLEEAISATLGNKDFKAFMKTHCDEIGIPMDSLTSALLRMLTAKNVTLAASDDYWCSSLQDDGSLDMIRLYVLKLLLLMFLTGAEILDFPHRIFTASIINCLRFYFNKSRSISVKDPIVRTKLVHAGLVVMLWTGTKVTDMDITADDYNDVFASVITTLERPGAFIDVNSFLLPHAVHYFNVISDDVISKCDTVFIENILHIVDWWREHDSILPASLLIAKMVEFPEVIQKMNARNPSYGSDLTLHDDLWGSMIIEIISRSIAGREKLIPILTAIACRILPYIDNVAQTVLAQLIDVVMSLGDIESQKQLIRTFHWCIGSKKCNNMSLLVQILMKNEVIRNLVQTCPDFDEGVQLVDYIRRQNEKLSEMKKGFTTEELKEILSNAENLAELYDVSENPPAISLDIAKYNDAVKWILISDFMVVNKQYKLSYDYLTESKA